MPIELLIQLPVYYIRLDKSSTHVGENLFEIKSRKLSSYLQPRVRDVSYRRILRI